MKRSASISLSRRFRRCCLPDTAEPGETGLGYLQSSYARQIPPKRNDRPKRNGVRIGRRRWHLPFRQTAAGGPALSTKPVPTKHTRYSIMKQVSGPAHRDRFNNRREMIAIKYYHKISYIISPFSLPCWHGVCRKVESRPPLSEAAQSKVWPVGLLTSVSGRSPCPYRPECHCGRWHVGGPNFFGNSLALLGRKLRFQWERARLSAVFGWAVTALAVRLPSVGFATRQHPVFGRLRETRSPAICRTDCRFRSRMSHGRRH